MSRTQRLTAAGRIMPIKNSSNTIGNRTRNLPACSAVPQRTASSRTPRLNKDPVLSTRKIMFEFCWLNWSSQKKGGKWLKGNRRRSVVGVGNGDLNWGSCPSASLPNQCPPNGRLRALSLAVVLGLCLKKTEISRPRLDIGDLVSMAGSNAVASTQEPSHIK